MQKIASGKALFSVGFNLCSNFSNTNKKNQLGSIVASCQNNCWYQYDNVNSARVIQSTKVILADPCHPPNVEFQSGKWNTFQN